MSPVCLKLALLHCNLSHPSLMAYVLIFATYLYHLWTGDSIEHEKTHDATRKLTQSRVRSSDRAPWVASAADNSRGTRTRGCSQAGTHGRAAQVEEIEEEQEEQELVPTKNMKSMSRKNWKVIRKENPYRFHEQTCMADTRFWTMMPTSIGDRWSLRWEVLPKFIVRHDGNTRISIRP